MHRVRNVGNKIISEIEFCVGDNIVHRFVYCTQCDELHEECETIGKTCIHQLVNAIKLIDDKPYKNLVGDM